MVDVVALCAGRGHDGRVGDRGNVIAADRACQDGGDRDDHHLLVCRLEHGNHDGNQDGERAPAGAGRERDKDRNQEDDERDNRDEVAGQVQVAGDKVADTKLIAHALQGPREGQDQDRGGHHFGSLRQRAHEILEADDLSGQVQDARENNGDDGREDQGDLRVAPCERIDHVGCAVEITGVDHRADRSEDHNGHGKDQVDDLALVGLHRGLVFLGKCLELLAAGSEQVAFFRVSFMFSHETEIDAPGRDEEDHEQSQQCVQVVGDGADEQLEAVHAAALRHIGIDCCGPAGNRCDDTHRRCRCINNIGQLCAGDLVLVRDRAHDGTDRQAVEIVIDKDQDTQQGCREHRLLLVFEPLTGPASVRGSAAAAGHQDDDHAQQNIEDDDVQIHAVDHRSEQCGERIPRMKTRDHHCAQRHAAEQRQIDFFCDQCQQDRDHRRDQRHPGTVKHSFSLLI